MAQTMALDTQSVCLYPMVLDDGIQGRYSQWLALVLPFHDKKYPVGAAGRSLFV
jgi:hypothetical protein